MKKKVVLHDNINNKDIKGEVEIPAKDHLAAQIKYPARVIKPKKGKGSFRRKKSKIVVEDE